MISFKKLSTIFENNRGLKTQLRKHGINPTQLNKMLNNGDFGGKTINKLCKLLNCQPGDIMEYVPDETETSDDTGN